MIIVTKLLDNPNTLHAHLSSDTSRKELIEFGNTIGLHESWLKVLPCGLVFDLARNDYKKAVDAGAEIVDICEFHERAIQNISSDCKGEN